MIFVEMEEAKKNIWIASKKREREEGKTFDEWESNEIKPFPKTWAIFPDQGHERMPELKLFIK